jgi:uncharacterized protein YidB (DUF937 family)
VNYPEIRAGDGAAIVAAVKVSHGAVTIVAAAHQVERALTVPVTIALAQHTGLEQDEQHVYNKTK